MAIQYIHPDTGDKVVKEPWRWVAVYNDDSSLEQFAMENGQPVFHRFAEIDNDRLVIFKLVHDNHPEIAVMVPPGAAPVHFYRHRQIHELLNQDGGEQLTRQWKLKTWCIGFKQGGNYWLVFVDDLGKAVYTADKDMFLDNYTGY